MWKFNDFSIFYCLKQMAFYICPLISAFTIFSLVKSQYYSIKEFLDIQFFSIISAFLLRVGHAFALETLLESSFAFILGAYVIYYLFEKNWFYLGISFFFMCMGHKRIVILAILLSAMVLLIKRLPIKIQNTAVFITASFEITILYLYLYFCYSPAFYDLRMSLSFMFSGRIMAWETIRKYYEFNIFFNGKGIGYVLSLLQELNIPYFRNLHNDVLSLYIELGFIGGIMWLILYFSIVITTKKPQKIFIFALISYHMVNLCTDNISIYIMYLIPFYIIMLCLINQNEGREREHERYAKYSLDGKASLFVE